MKNLLLIPAMCLLCYSCSCNNNGPKDNDPCAPTCGKSTSVPCCNDNVIVQAPASAADWDITTKVKTAIMSDGSLSASARFVAVHTTNGVVMLSGNVASTQDRDRIIRIAKNVSGVKNVISHMTVSS